MSSSHSNNGSSNAHVDVDENNGSAAPDLLFHDDDGGSHVPTLREKAFREAQQVLDSEGWDSSELQGFNLLGVVTNPRAGLHPHHHGHHHQNTPQGAAERVRQSIAAQTAEQQQHHHLGFSLSLTPAAAGTGNNTTNLDTTTATSPTTTTTTNASSTTTTDSYYELTSYMESAVINMTEHMDYWNAALDQFSKQYLGASPLLLEEEDNLEYAPEMGVDDVPSVQLQELPDELAHLTLDSVEEYLRTSGLLAQSLVSRQEQAQLWSSSSKTTTSEVTQTQQQSDNNNDSAVVNVQKQDDGQKGKRESKDGGDNSKTTTSFQQSQRRRWDEQDAMVSTSMHSNDSKNLNNTFLSIEEQLQSVPEIFFEPYFNLTDPETFQSLLVDDNADEISVTAAQAPLPNGPVGGQTPKSSNNNRSTTNDIQNAGAEAEMQSQQQPQQQQQQQQEQQQQTQPPKRQRELPPALAIPTKDILKIPPPDSLTSHLDKVELCLLQQVRSKSMAFFHETNRFSQLRDWISESVETVQQLRETLKVGVEEGAVVGWEFIPKLDDGRRDLHKLEDLLEGASHVLECKASIGGLLSAGDYLGAVEQVQYGRNLLMGNSINGGGEESSSPQYDLSKLHALRTVGQQLTQYETLIINNLSEELVDLFLSWEDTSSSSTSLLSSSSFDSMPPSANGEGGGTPSLVFTGGRRKQKHQRVRNIVRALDMCHKLTNAGKMYQDRLCDTIQMTVRTTVGEFAKDAAAAAAAASGSGPTTTDGSTTDTSSVTEGVTSMSLDNFLDCLDMMFEQMTALLQSAMGVHKFCRQEGYTLKDETTASSITHKQQQETLDETGPSPPAPPASPALSSSSLSSSRAISATAEAVSAATDLVSKSISELLRLRKEAHSLVTLEEMKQLWDSCLGFTLKVEKWSGQKAYGLRSTLLAQAKAFVERKHESNMSALVAALDSERWMQCDVSAERQSDITRLCSGRAGLSSTLLRRKSVGGGGQTDASTAASSAMDAASMGKTTPDVEVEGIRYKVVWSCLLLVEMIMGNVTCAAHFQTLATNVVGKVSELLRLFNSRTTSLVLGAGAIHSTARLKSINAKHLCLVTQCLGVAISILPHIRAALMAQLPSKQHTLLLDLDKIKKEYADHNDKVLGKFVSIIGGIVEHGLTPRISQSDFDARAKKEGVSKDKKSVACCPFLDGVSTNVRKMHQVLYSLLPPEHLQDVFSRIFAFIDNKVPSLFLTAAASAASSSSASSAVSPKGGGKAKPPSPSFFMPKTDKGKQRMLLEVETMTITLNRLPGVRPWDFTAIGSLARTLEIEWESSSSSPPTAPAAPAAKITTAAETRDAVFTSTTESTAAVTLTAEREGEPTTQPPPPLTNGTHGGNGNAEVSSIAASSTEKNEKHDGKQQAAVVDANGHATSTSSQEETDNRDEEEKKANAGNEWMDG